MQEKKKMMRSALHEDLFDYWRTIVSDFTSAVTVQSSGEDGLLPKNGDESIFSVFKCMCPQAR
jgi:hypothetical protein